MTDLEFIEHVKAVKATCKENYVVNVHLTKIIYVLLRFHKNGISRFLFQMMKNNP